MDLLRRALNFSENGPLPKIAFISIDLELKNYLIIRFVTSKERK